jgi:hypothetical protein
LQPLTRVLRLSPHDAAYLLSLASRRIAHNVPRAAS